jgi:hypothetical protein
MNTGQRNKRIHKTEQHSYLQLQQIEIFRKFGTFKNIISLA